VAGALKGRGAAPVQTLCQLVEGSLSFPPALATVFAAVAELKKEKMRIFF
jgi:hypothetical protein